MKWFLIALCLFVLPVCAHAQSGTEINLANRPTVYWAPPESGGKQPLILFSHGYLGCGTQSKFLTSALAAAGYWVFAPDHNDAICKHGLLGAVQNSDKSFGRPDRWDDTTYAVRGRNISDLLDALRHDPEFSQRIDFSRVGLMGHSLGGYTVMGLAGAWPKWKMKDIKAVLALSPYCEPFNIKHSFVGIVVPIMYQGGTRDGAITPFITKADGCYAQTMASKYYVEFQGATHFAWTDMERGFQQSIATTSIAFFDHYVKGLPASHDLTSVRDDVSTLWYKSELGQAE